MKHLFFFSTLSFFFLFSCNNKTENKDVLVQDSEKKQETKISKLFTKLESSSSGIDFKNHNVENDDFNYYSYEYFYNGGGVAVADLNNDGLEDIVFVGNMSLNEVYINKGNLQFENISSVANINSGESEWCTGVNIIDINQDGFQDIFIARSGWWDKTTEQRLRNLLYINNGDLTFTEKGLAYGLTDLSHTTQTCFFDKDNDGDLDLYVLNHPIAFGRTAFTPSGEDIKHEGYLHSDKIYENVNGKFVNVTKKLKMTNYGHGLGVMASDFNNDGWQDLYVGNDFREPDYIYINQKNGTFINENEKAFKHMSKFSMGLDVGDINNDGLQDIFNAEMLAKDNFTKKTNMPSMNVEMYWNFVNNGYQYQDMHNSLQLNNGNGTFSEIAWLSGIAETGWSWCPLIADFDNDGNKDLFVTNGYKRDVVDKDFLKKLANKFDSGVPKKFSNFKDIIPASKIPNYILKNNGNLIFDDKTKEWGMNFPMNSNGAAYADFDNDGDLDLVISNIDDKAVLYKNNLDSQSSYLDIELLNGIKIPYGSKVEILDFGKYQMLELTNVHGYQSKSTSILHFGLGDKMKLDSLLITWPGGKQTLLSNLEINKTHNVNFNSSKFTTYTKPKSKAFFTDVTKEKGINFIHQENEYDDYKKEILLPHKLSQEGPFISVADVNGDQLEDFFVGNGVGFAGELYIQTQEGEFIKSHQKAFSKDYMCEDLGVLFFDFDSDGDQDLYVVSGSNEYSLESESMQDRLYQNDGSGNFTKTANVLPKMPASGSCVKASDFDSDGDLDLFVGGFQMPGQYPKAGTSYLLQNTNGKFEIVTNKLANGLKEIGMVKDALFTDLNNDGKIDLIVTGHWMPIEIFINENNHFINKSEEYKTKNKIGWFNAVLVEDINNDGYKDIIAGNIGTNTKHKASVSEPFKIYADDFDGNGTNDIILGYYNDGICYPVRGKQCSSEQIPSLNQKIPSYNQFGTANIFQIYGMENLEKATHFDATHFESIVLLNQKGESFIFNNLPNECQFAPTNGILSIDIDNDDQNEILLVGNHYPVEIETGRYDAHVGNVLVNEKGILMNKNNTGFFMNLDARSIHEIMIQNSSYVLISSNRSMLTLFKIN